MAEQRRAFWDLQPLPPAKPIDMVLHCPKCGLQHVDHPEVAGYTATRAGTITNWHNPPHRSHLCKPDEGGCGTIWRPADVPTNGVRAVATRGQADTWPDGVSPSPPSASACAAAIRKGP